ncbi:hypothetical protein QYE76_013331 [Lolium multiflorum]|uniref:RNase H type-1 domain-containing protein n=1 Tax=Lolium multiflorum TaxID=4521 RepID=A0AAD8X7I0_LOLMU|nr:hypothetical protein QYE76_013331 [Lolium multiflorum]
MNVDAGWNEGEKLVGLGVVIRDAHGQVVQSSWHHIPSCSSAEEAEALACLEGLKSIQLLYYDRAVVESDCLSVVQALTSDDRNLSHCWSTVLDAKGLQRAFDHISVSKIDRVSNGVAHSIAQLGKSGFGGESAEKVETAEKTLGITTRSSGQKVKKQSGPRDPSPPSGTELRRRARNTGAGDEPLGPAPLGRAELSRRLRPGDELRSRARLRAGAPSPSRSSLDSLHSLSPFAATAGQG